MYIRFNVLELLIFTAEYICVFCSFLILVSYGHYAELDGFVGLVVSMLASGTQVCGFKPGRSRWIFTGVKILSIPSSGGEVK